IGQWMEVIDSWYHAYSRPLEALRMEALESLLRAELAVAEALRGEMEIRRAPAPAKVPKRYVRRPVSARRPRQRKLEGWDRFATADGFFPGLARLVVAGGIVGGVAAFSGTTLDISVAVHNGLARSVDVRLGESSATVAPRTSTTFRVRPDPHLRVSAKVTDG